jgi:hypothetical protein
MQQKKERREQVEETTNKYLTSIVVDTGTPPEGILIPLYPVFYPKRRS